MSITTGRRNGVKFGFLSILSSLVAAFSINPSANAANYYIDPNYAGVNGAPYGIYTAAYNNIDAALGASGVPAGTSATNPNYLYFAPGTYNVGTTSLAYSDKDVDLVGLTGNPNDVVITSTLDANYVPGPGASTIGTTGSATLQLKGNNQSASFITFANSTDTPYIVNDIHLNESPTGTFPALNGAGAANTSNGNNQAVALLLQGDEQTFYDVKVEGYQDSLYTKGGRSIFNNSYITGDVDFIFANGTTVFNNSTINIDSDHTGGDITAASTAKTTSNGLVFLNSTITGNSTAGNSVTDPHNGGNANPTAANTMYLGRPYGWTQPGGDSSTVFINTPIASVGGVSIIKPAGWLAWDSNETNPAFIPAGASANSNGGNPGEDSRYAEYNSTDLTTGNPENVASRVTWSHQLVASQAADYTLDNIFSESYPWYGDGYPATDTDINGAGGPAAGTGSANPSASNYSWPAFWGDRNVNNETTAETSGLSNDPASYADSNWTLGGNWDPTNALALAVVEVPEPATMTIVAGFIILPLARRPRRRLAR
jgi:pectin methylesterase-like acyl-CoA thioesterase